jgi:hypothetical protein
MSMSGALDEWLTERLSPEDISCLRTVDVCASEQHGFDLVNLLRGWKRHVDKIEHDLPLPSSDRSVWGAHDLVAAVSLRSFLQEGLDELEPELRRRVERVMGEVDERFQSYTEVDEFGLLEQIDGRSNPSRGWWWRRIPKTGPAREELNLYGGIGG